ncbi:MAG: hypothetical protein ABIR54_23195 [Burkholderiaceae bacterium]|jgi:hypothetical protein
MNKREFVAGSMAAAVAAPTLARSTDAAAAPGALRNLLTRTQRLPDLAEQAGADAFEAYIGERFDVVGGIGIGEQLVVATVERVARCKATEQFTVAFAPSSAGAALSSHDGVRLLVHATGQRVALLLERSREGYAARFNLLT